MGPGEVFGGGDACAVPSEPDGAPGRRPGWTQVTATPFSLMKAMELREGYQRTPPETPAGRLVAWTGRLAGGDSRWWCRQRLW